MPKIKWRKKSDSQLGKSSIILGPLNISCFQELKIYYLFCTICDLHFWPWRKCRKKWTGTLLLFLIFIYLMQHLFLFWKSLLGLVFWNSIHLEVASDSFCFLINSSWLLVFILFLFLHALGLNLYWWKGIHFSQNLDLIFLHLLSGFIISFHFWFRDLLRELNKKYEVLLIILFLVFLLFLVSEGLLFVSFFWTSFHSLSSPRLAKG